MGGRLRILIADDHEVVRSGFRRLLEQIADFEVVAEAATGADAYRLIVATEPDVAILDISMPGMSGIETIRRIRARGARARLLIFSVHESAGVVQRALDAGADGYLSKAGAADEMIEAVRAVAAGRRYLGAALAARLAGAATAPDGERGFGRLTRREFEVLRLFCGGGDIDQVAAALYVSPKTVANNLSSIKQKLGARSHADVVRLALEGGLTDALRA